MTGSSATTALLVNWYSSADLSRVLASLRTRAGRPDLLRYLIVDNTAGRDLELSKLAGPDVEILAADPGDRRGSWGHAFGLTRGFERIATPYALLCDPDVHVFLDEWDERLQAAMAEAGAIAVGAPYPWWKLGKYHDFPSPVFALLDVPAVRRLGADWTPFATNPVRRTYDLVARQIVRMGMVATRKRLLATPWLASLGRRLERILGVCGPDTGYRLAAAARRAGATAVLFDPVAPSEISTLGSAASGLARHFELYRHRDLPAVVHRYSTRARIWRTDRGHEDRYFRACIELLEESQLP